jgi:hypothetical protein
MIGWLVAAAVGVVALFLGLGLALARFLFERLVLRLQVAPVTVHSVEIPIDATVSLEGAIIVEPISVKGKVLLADGLPVKIGEIRIRPSDVGARIE